MTLSKQIAEQIREVLIDGTWVATNYKTQLYDVNWVEATTKVKDLNTIAALTFHINYYIDGLIQVFQGGTLDMRDKYSFDVPPITSQTDWDWRLRKLWSNAETFSRLIEKMDDVALMQPFVDEKYGNNYINIQAMIEHCYYHLGQIVLIKKLIQANS